MSLSIYTNVCICLVCVCVDAQMETVAAEREEAQGRDGSELSELRGKLATAIKDNRTLLQVCVAQADDGDDALPKLLQVIDRSSDYSFQAKTQSLRPD